MRTSSPVRTIVATIAAALSWVGIACNWGSAVEPGAALGADTWRCGISESAALAQAALAQAPGVATAAVGVKSVLFVRVDYSDLVGEPISEASALTLMDEVDTFYVQSSFGQLSFTSTVTPVIRMPKTMAYYVGGRLYLEMKDDAVAAAAAAGFNPNGYDRMVLAFAKTVGWGWSGLADLDNPYVLVNGRFTLGVVAHEMGHTFGLNHAALWVATNDTIIGPDGISYEYGNVYDMMGGGSIAVNQSEDQFGVLSKQHLGWLAPNAVQEVTASGTYRIHALEQPASGLHGIWITRAGGAVSLWVEYRDRASTPVLRYGALVNMGGVFGFTSLLDFVPATFIGNDAPLLIGRTFSDGNAGIYITPLRRVDTTTPPSLDVVINLGQFPGNRNPTVSVAASSMSAPQGSSLTFTATASDPDGDALSYYWDFGRGLVSTSSDAMVTQVFVNALEYNVRCVASDMKGGQASASLVVTIGAPATSYRISGHVSGAAPVEGVRVGYASLSTFTNSDGSFMLVGLPAGTNALNAIKPGYTFQPTFSNPLTLNGNLANLDFIASASGSTISGKVLSAGLGMPGVLVSDGPRSATSDANGDYAVLGVPDGFHTLTASKTGWSFDELSSYEVLGTDRVGADLHARGQTIAGFISGVTTAPTVSDGIRTVTASSDGVGGYYYAINNVPDGSWTLSAIVATTTLVPSSFTNPVTVAGTGLFNMNFAPAPPESDGGGPPDGAPDSGGSDGLGGDGDSLGSDDFPAAGDSDGGSALDPGGRAPAVGGCGGCAATNGGAGYVGGLALVLLFASSARRRACRREPATR